MASIAPAAARGVVARLGSDSTDERAAAAQWLRGILEACPADSSAVATGGRTFALELVAAGAAERLVHSVGWHWAAREGDEAACAILTLLLGGRAGAGAGASVASLLATADPVVVSTVRGGSEWQTPA